MLTENEIWNFVKSLQNSTIYTYVEKSENFITKVEDTGKSSDRIIIKGRKTFPIKEDIIAAYKLLYSKKEIFLRDDLSWLAVPEKQTSSITFRILGELVKEEATLIKGKKISLKLKTT